MNSTKKIYRSDEVVGNEQSIYSELKILEQSNREKSELLLSMSHNMRTPLNAIIGLISLMENEVQDPGKMKESICKLKSSCRYLLSMINDMLDMNSIESQLLTINNSDFELGSLIEDINTVIV